MAVAKKDAALRMRLDNLESELKTLHSTILLKRTSKISLNENSSGNSSKIKGETVMRQIKSSTSSEQSTLSSHRSMNECKGQLLKENHILKQKLLSLNNILDENNDLKKKLKEEKAKRRVEMPEMLDPIKANIAHLQNEYMEEKQRREDVEKELMMVLDKLEESEYRSLDLAESKELAVAFADQFRHRYETDGYFIMDKGRGDVELAVALKNQQQQNMQLIKELRDHKENQDSQLYSLKEELNFLRNNMKNPLDDPQVKTVIEKHKIAYGELLLAKNSMESEYEEKFKTFEEELQGLQEIHDSKVFELTGIVQNLKIKLQEKTECIANFTSEQNAYNDAIKRIKSSAGDLSAINKQQDDMIRVLKESVAEKDKSLEIMGKELSSMHESTENIKQQLNELMEKYDEVKNENNIIQERMNDGLDTIAIKEKIINDQLDTIKSLRIMVDNSNKTLSDLRKERDDLSEKFDIRENKNRDLEAKLRDMEEQMKDLEKYKEGQQKHSHSLLKHLESQVYDDYQVFQRQKEWENQIAQMCREKDQAMDTAKFATKRLMQTVMDYGNKLADEKKIQSKLQIALQEKEEELKLTLHKLDAMCNGMSQGPKNDSDLEEAWKNSVYGTHDNVPKRNQVFENST